MAVLLASLAPGISRMLSGLRDQQVAWVEVCSAQGARWVAVDAGDVSSDPLKQKPQGHGEGHCPFCLLQGHDMAPPPAVFTPVILAGVDVLPFLFLHAPSPLHAWSKAHARAPPALA